MRKRKDGKIVASLTEVKNKTGDIFSLVDEFGEVLLTSYNKPKYKIVKVSISESINLDDHEEDTAEVAEQPKPQTMLDRVKNSILGTEEKLEEKEDDNGLIPSQILAQLKNLVAWDNSNKKEIQFISSIKKSLQ